MSQPKDSFQKIFFDRLIKRFSSRSEMVAEVGKQLHLGRDAVYRRLRGDTILSADELMVLSKVFEVSLESRRSSTSGLPIMRYLNGDQIVVDEVSYLDFISDYANRIAGIPGVRIDFASPELPFYYELATPTLRTLKVYMYSLTSWIEGRWKGEKFSSDLLSPESHAKADALVRDTFSVEGRELWSIGILDVTLRQINYLAQIGMFADLRDLYALYEELMVIINHLEQMAMAGKRFAKGESPTEDSPNFTVYHNELSNTNNVVLVRSEESQTVFSGMINPSFLVSNDPRLYADVQSWFERLVQHSNSLNAGANKYSRQYFGHLRSQVEMHRDRSHAGGFNF